MLTTAAMDMINTITGIGDRADPALVADAAVLGPLDVTEGATIPPDEPPLMAG
jgi:hypothetical protein